MENANGRVRKVNDVFLTLIKGVGPLLVYTLGGLALLYINTDHQALPDQATPYEIISQQQDYFYMFLAGFVPVVIFCIRTFRSYAMGVVIDSTNNELSFPASDVELSVFEIITLKKFRNLQHRSSVPLNEVEGLTNDIKRWESMITKIKNVRYLLNVSGTFGSQQFEFSSKQKRDECRSAINAGIREVGEVVSSSDVDIS